MLRVGRKLLQVRYPVFPRLLAIIVAFCDLYLLLLEGRLAPGQPSNSLNRRPPATSVLASQDTLLGSASVGASIFILLLLGFVAVSHERKLVAGRSCIACAQGYSNSLCQPCSTMVQGVGLTWLFFWRKERRRTAIEVRPSQTAIALLPA